MKYHRPRPIRPSDAVAACTFLGYARRDLIHALRDLVELRPAAIAEVLLLKLTTIERELRQPRDWEHLRAVRDRIAHNLELEKTRAAPFIPGVTVGGEPLSPEPGTSSGRSPRPARRK